MKPLLVIAFAALALVLGAARSEAQEATGLDPVQVAVTLDSAPLVQVTVPPLPSPLDAAPVPELLTLATDPPLPAVLAIPDVPEATTDHATAVTARAAVRVAPPIAPVEDVTDTTGRADLESLAIARPTALPTIATTTGPAPSPEPAADVGPTDDGVPPHRPAPPSTSVEGTCTPTSPRHVVHGPWSGLCADARASAGAGEPLAPIDARGSSSANEHSITARGPPGGVVG